MSNRDIRLAFNRRFFVEFVRWHTEWLRLLVARYKERGQYPVLPTQIIEYYPDTVDKEVAIISTLCMEWDSDTVLQQIAAMRELMGPSPYEWFAHRDYAAISIGRLQDERLDGTRRTHYWKIAQTFELLHRLCEDGRELQSVSKVLRGRKMEAYCQQVFEVCSFTYIGYKQRVIELVLKTTDGIGRGVWRAKPESVLCPRNPDLSKFIQMWMPMFRYDSYDWDEAVSLFNLEYPYDFFYAYLAWEELKRYNPVQCRQYQQRYKYRFDNRLSYRRSAWWTTQKIVPDINF